MWTFDDKVREAIRNSYDLLTRVDAAKPETEQAFLAVIPDVLDAFRDLLGKEQEVLLPPIPLLPQHPRTIMALVAIS